MKTNSNSNLRHWILRIVYALIFLYASIALATYIKAIFFRNPKAYYYYELTFKDHILILVFLICYLLGSALFFVGLKRKGDVLLIIGSFGFMIGAVLDLICNASYSIIFYLIYIFGNLIILFFVDKEILRRHILILLIIGCLILTQIIYFLIVRGNLIM